MSQSQINVGELQEKYNRLLERTGYEEEQIRQIHEHMQPYNDFQTHEPWLYEDMPEEYWYPYNSCKNPLCKEEVDWYSKQYYCCDECVNIEQMCKDSGNMCRGSELAAFSLSMVIRKQMAELEDGKVKKHLQKLLS